MKGEAEMKAYLSENKKWCFLLVGLVMGLVFSSSAHAVTQMELLEVTGILERVEAGEQGEIITLNVNGKVASGPLDPGCRFMDERGQTMEKTAFLQRYMKRIVTLELEAESGVVMFCRVGV